MSGPLKGKKYIVKAFAPLFAPLMLPAWGATQRSKSALILPNMGRSHFNRLSSVPWPMDRSGHNHYRSLRAYTQGNHLESAEEKKSIDPKESAFNTPQVIQCPVYGIDYQLSASEKLKYQQLEYQLPANAHEVQKHLSESTQLALKQQQLERPKSARRILPSQHKTLAYPFESLRKNSEPFEMITVPEEVKDNLPIDLQYDPRLNQAIASCHGQRRQMEDAHVASQLEIKAKDRDMTVILNAIMDGHGSDLCAKFVAENLTSFLSKQLIHYLQNEFSPQAVVFALMSTAVHLDQYYNSEYLPQGAYEQEAGCTLNISLEMEDQLFLANVGDSRAFFVQDDGDVMQLSADHNLEEQSLRQQIHDRGGFVVKKNGIYRALGSLAMARAIGNHWANGAISAKPNVACFDKSTLTGGLLVQACDGIFETASTEQVGQRIHRLRSQGLSLPEIAKDLIQAACATGSFDNLSVSIRQLR